MGGGASSISFAGAGCGGDLEILWRFLGIANSGMLMRR